jgi:hypothetical protein
MVLSGRSQVARDPQYPAANSEFSAKPSRQQTGYPHFEFEPSLYFNVKLSHLQINQCEDR